MKGLEYHRKDLKAVKMILPIIFQVETIAQECSGTLGREKGRNKERREEGRMKEGKRKRGDKEGRKKERTFKCHTTISAGYSWTHRIYTTV